MHDTSYDTSELLDLLWRRTAAATRGRRLVAHELRLSETEAEALGHLVRSATLTPGRLGSLLGLTSGGVTALIQRLEAAGHVMRRPNPADRRSTLVLATPRAITSVKRHDAAIAAEVTAVTERRSPAERAIIGRWLEEIAAAAERHADQTRRPRASDERRRVAALWE